MLYIGQAPKLPADHTFPATLMTEPTSNDTSAAAPSKGLMASTPTSILLKHPASKTTGWVLTLIYYAAMAFSLPALALIAMVFMPLGVGPENPRRALHLWTLGLVASGVFIIKARAVVRGLGGLNAAMSSDPVLTASLMVGVVVALGVVLWHLSWVSSPRDPDDVTTSKPL